MYLIKKGQLGQINRFHQLASKLDNFVALRITDLNSQHIGRREMGLFDVK